MSFETKDIVFASVDGRAPLPKDNPFFAGLSEDELSVTEHPPVRLCCFTTRVHEDLLAHSETAVILLILYLKFLGHQNLQLCRPDSHGMRNFASLS